MAFFSAGEERSYSMNRGHGGPQRWSGRFGVEKNLLPLPGFEVIVVQLRYSSIHFEARLFSRTTWSLYCWYALGVRQSVTRYEGLEVTDVEP